MRAYDEFVMPDCPADELPKKFRLARSRIMYIERKAGELTGPARIGRVYFSKSGLSLYYKGKTFGRLKGGGFKSNYYDVETKEDYWISGPKRNGEDALYATNVCAEIDEDVCEEYWTKIRKKPSLKNKKTT